MDEDLREEDFVEDSLPVDVSNMPQYKGEYIDIDMITIPKDRFREEITGLQELSESIAKLGLLQPICIDRDYILVAGHRRLLACKRLGLKEVRIQFLEGLDALTRREIELEENLQRKAFTWIEEVKAKAEIDKIKKKKHGEEGWSLRDSANALGVSLGGLHQDIELAEAIEYFPELMQEKSKTVAHKKYKKLLEDRIRKELIGRSDFLTDKARIVLGDCRDIVKTLGDNSIDLIYTDPPYGINVEETVGAKLSSKEIYDDTTSSYIKLMNDLVPEWYRVLKENRFLYVWFAHSMFMEVVEILLRNDFTVRLSPIIWNKETPGAVLGIPKLAPTFEPCLQCWKGSFPGLSTSIPDVLSYRRVVDKRYHPLEHPVLLDATIIEVSSKVGDTVLDCFGGGGSSYEACIRLNRIPLVIEKDPKYYAAILERAAEIKLKEVTDDEDNKYT